MTETTTAQDATPPDEGDVKQHAWRYVRKNGTHENCADCGLWRTKFNEDMECNPLSRTQEGK